MDLNGSYMRRDLEEHEAYLKKVALNSVWVFKKITNLMND